MPGDYVARNGYPFRGCSDKKLDQAKADEQDAGKGLCKTADQSHQSASAKAVSQIQKEDGTDAGRSGRGNQGKAGDAGAESDSKVIGGQCDA